MQAFTRRPPTLPSSLRPLCETLRQRIRQFLATRLVNTMDSQCISWGVGGLKAWVDDEESELPPLLCQRPHAEGQPARGCRG